MLTYVTLIRWTQKGVDNVKESSARLDAAKKTMRDMGTEFRAFYLVTGRYDIVTIVEAPNDETMTKINLALGSRGAVRTETLRAFTEDEFRKISALP
jgi:uncharacterized protein with GYD domain